MFYFHLFQSLSQVLLQQQSKYSNLWLVVAVIPAHRLRVQTQHLLAQNHDKGRHRITWVYKGKHGSYFCSNKTWFCFSNFLQPSIMNPWISAHLATRVTSVLALVSHTHKIFPLFKLARPEHELRSSCIYFILFSSYKILHTIQWDHWKNLGQQTDRNLGQQTDVFIELLRN